MDCNPALVEIIVDHIEQDRSQSSFSTLKRRKTLLMKRLRISVRLQPLFHLPDRVTNWSGG